MKCVIVEDEIVAARKLERLIQQFASDFQVITVLQTVEESIEWFSLNDAPDLVFMDIHLADGSSFAIFDKVQLACPIIFTTAYDEYALKAFEVNSIDYLLKPINEKNFEHAISKFRGLKATVVNNSDLISSIYAAFNASKSSKKSSFLIPYKDKLIPLAIDKIACFYMENKVVKIVTMNQDTYSMDSSLEELYLQLDPTAFFRANRQFIVAHKAIKDISIWFGSKLSINVIVPVPEKIVVSKARVPEFKSWYTK